MHDRWSEVVANTRAAAGGVAEDWIAAIPAALPELARRWGLTLGDPFPVETVGYVLPGRRGDGLPVVLKLEFPRYAETSFAQEVAGLEIWDGAGCVRLLEHDADVGAMLLERAMPGTSLLAQDQTAALVAAASVLRRLWSARPPPDRGITSLSAQASAWAQTIEREWHRAGEPFEHELVEAARCTLLDLGPHADRSPVLLHGDLHHGNVLAAEREPWLAIDPKPRIGEAAFDARAPLCDRRSELLSGPGALDRLAGRVDLLTERLELERDRVLGWAFAVEVTWSIGGFGSVSGTGFAREQLEVARLLRRLRA